MPGVVCDRRIRTGLAAQTTVWALVALALLLPAPAGAATLDRTSALTQASTVRVSSIHEVVTSAPTNRVAMTAQPLSMQPAVWFADDFESGSLSGWHLIDANTWGASTHRPSTGSYSAWCLGASGLSTYPDDYIARMSRGPYDLSTSSGLTVFNADMWVQSEQDYDFVKMMVSTDGSNYYGYEWSGEGTFWQAKSLDLRNIYTLGNVAQSPHVWVMLEFESDEDNSGLEGAYFDNVTLKDTAVPAPDLVSDSLSASATAHTGMPIAVTDTVHNQGSADAAGFNVSYYLSTDASITPSDTLLGTRRVAALARGATSSATTNFTVPAGLSGNYYIGTVVDPTGEVGEVSELNNSRLGNAVAVSDEVRPTALVLTSLSAPALSYGSSFEVDGVLTDTTGGLVGKQVRLQSARPGSAFADTGVTAMTGAGGAFTFWVTPQEVTNYAVRPAATPEYATSLSGSVRATPLVSLGNPVVPKGMRHTKSYSVYGSLKPRHAAGSKPVRIYKYLYIGGKWKAQGYVTAAASNYGAFSRYKATLRLSRKGKWRLNAYAPADAEHAATWSGYTPVKVG